MKENNIEGGFRKGDFGREIAEGRLRKADCGLFDCGIKGRNEQERDQ